MESKHKNREDPSRQDQRTGGTKKRYGAAGAPAKRQWRRTMSPASNSTYEPLTVIC
jgi:hypothetical protein